MKRASAVFALGLAAALIPGFVPPAAAQVQDEEQRITLKDQPGRDLVRENCVSCHSLDYIPMNSVFLDRKGWEAEVTKMVKVNGAPIDDETQARILDYLVAAYGKHQ
jgi:mono/diheme cytochrome c family protein